LNVVGSYSSVIGFQAGTAIADATSIYLRDDGEVGCGTDNHVLNRPACFLVALH
jgi:hypothetical protein